MEMAFHLCNQTKIIGPKWREAQTLTCVVRDAHHNHHPKPECRVSKTFLEVIKIFQRTKKRRFEKLVYIIREFFDPYSQFCVILYCYHHDALVHRDGNNRERQDTERKVEKTTDDVDQLFEPSFFGSLEDLQDFEKRFRPLSIQVQDHECGKLIPNVKDCASRHFGPDDLRFWDAVIDSTFFPIQHTKLNNLKKPIEN
ncbi:hypothetical protein P8452_60932 [Trifolium repens]|nr:hypothetical protein P8452_60932 [Trifolium repens]